MNEFEKRGGRWACGRLGINPDSEPGWSTLGALLFCKKVVTPELIGKIQRAQANYLTVCQLPKPGTRTPVKDPRWNEERENELIRQGALETDGSSPKHIDRPEPKFGKSLSQLQQELIRDGGVPYVGYNRLRVDPAHVPSVRAERRVL